jgi:hypothetical protein
MRRLLMFLLLPVLLVAGAAGHEKRPSLRPIKLFARAGKVKPGA